MASEDGRLEDGALRTKDAGNRTRHRDHHFNARAEIGACGLQPSGGARGWEGQTARPSAWNVATSRETLTTDRCTIGAMIDRLRSATSEIGASGRPDAPIATVG